MPQQITLLKVGAQPWSREFESPASQEGRSLQFFVAGRHMAYSAEIWHCGDYCNCRNARIFKDGIIFWEGRIWECEPDEEALELIRQELAEKCKELGIETIE